MLRLYPVDSSSVELVGYDDETSALYVRFRESGGLYLYSGVGATTFASLLEADSLGRYVNEVIKPAYAFRRLRSLPRSRRAS
jgi:hypothetical protein